MENSRESKKEKDFNSSRAQARSSFFTQLSQIESDSVLARTLQEQERAFMMLEANEEFPDDDQEEHGNDRNYSDDDDAFGFEDDDEVEMENSEEEYGDMEGIQEDVELEDTGYEDTQEDVDPGDLSYEELIALGDIVGTENRGLPQSVLSSLPSSTYTPQSSCNSTCTQCVICQYDYEEGDSLILLTCKHSFHSGCIHEWFQVKKVCPICGNEVSSPNC